MNTAATPDVASAPAGTSASPTLTSGTIPQGTSSPSAASYAYHTDHQGSVRAITDDAGQIVNAYAYDAYGNAEEAVESLTQPYRYTGREWDGVARIYHYRARAYDAETGRFLQEDPLGFAARHPKKREQIADDYADDQLLLGIATVYAAELNTYRYVSNNPVMFTDPSGKFGWGLYTGAVKRVKAMFASVNVAIRNAPQSIGIYQRGSTGRLFDSFTGRFVSEASISNVRKDAALSVGQGFVDGCSPMDSAEKPETRNGFAWALGYIAGKLLCS